MWGQLEAVDWLRGYGTRASCGQLLYPWPQVTRVIIDYYLAVQQCIECIEPLKYSTAGYTVK